MSPIAELLAISEQIKSRIAAIEQELEPYRELLEELDRLQAALRQLEDTAGPRASASATAARAWSGAAPRGDDLPRERSPRGVTRLKVLAALKDGPKTASEVSAKTGVPRASASTTLNKLKKSGEVVKAERGYRLAA